jgi:hypothetical protein
MSMFTTLTSSRDLEKQDSDGEYRFTGIEMNTQRDVLYLSTDNGRILFYQVGYRINTWVWQAIAGVSLSLVIIAIIIPCIRATKRILVIDKKHRELQQLIDPVISYGTGDVPKVSWIIDLNELQVTSLLAEGGCSSIHSKLFSFDCNYFQRERTVTTQFA